MPSERNVQYLETLGLSAAASPGKAKLPKNS